MRKREVLKEGKLVLVHLTDTGLKLEPLQEFYIIEVSKSSLILLA